MATKQELQINTLEIMMEQNAKDHEAIKSMILAFGNKLDESLERMENKFANKWAEKAWIWFFTIAGAASVWIVVRWVILLELK